VFARRGPGSPMDLKLGGVATAGESTKYSNNAFDLLSVAGGFIWMKSWSIVGEPDRLGGIWSERVPGVQCPFASSDEVRGDGDRKDWKN
jgi:hypothetical protein